MPSTASIAIAGSLLTLVAALALAFPLDTPITISRTVSSLTSGVTLNATVLKGGVCTSTDKYGSNDCSFAWNTNVSISLTAGLAKDIEKGATFTCDLKVDIVPLKFTCPICGGVCDIKIPIIGEQKITMPDCPIKAVPTATQILIAPIPAKDPAGPVNVKVSGTVSAVDHTGASLGSGSVIAEVKNK